MIIQISLLETHLSLRLTEKLQTNIIAIIIWLQKRKNGKKTTDSTYIHSIK